MNKNKNMGGGFSLGRGIFTAVSVVLLMIFLITAGVGLSRIRERLSDRFSYYDEAYYLRVLRTEEYQELLDMTLEDSGAGRVYEGDIPQCRAVAMYYDAALLCHAYTKAGSVDRAQFQKNRMERFAAQAGDYSEYTGKIDALRESYD